ncbi:MAG: nucleotidyltransferase family protein [Patescibacteria group bacterium]|nr:nucleotidyltransferase family protein [Patescibacteria group bacterium]
MTISSIKNKIAPILRGQGVKKAALFGSVARGETKKRSDIDLLIEYGDDSKSLLDFIGLKLDLEDVLKKKVDLVEYSALHPFLKDRILAEQVSIL